MRACMHAYVCVCMRVCVRARVYVCACVYFKHTFTESNILGGAYHVYLCTVKMLKSEEIRYVCTYVATAEIHIALLQQKVLMLQTGKFIQNGTI